MGPTIRIEQSVAPSQTPSNSMFQAMLVGPAMDLNSLSFGVIWRISSIFQIQPLVALTRQVGGNIKSGLTSRRRTSTKPAARKVLA